MSNTKKTGKLFLILAFSALLIVGVLSFAPAADYQKACGRTGWYFAEGCTGRDFDTWILIQNPNAVKTTADLRFFTPGGDPIPMTLEIEGNTRTSIYVNSIPGLENADVATEVKVVGDGIIAERAMYFSYGGSRTGGHSSIGAPGLSGNWYLPEGYTGGDFDTYVMLMNPGDQDALGVWVKLMKPQDGRYYPFKVDVPAGKRVTIKLDDLVWTEGTDNYITAVNEPPADPVQVKFDDTDVSTLVISGKPLIAELAMYYEYYGRAGGSSSIGATGTSSEWYLPEGYTGGDFDTYVLAMNPNSYPVDITYTFYSNQPGFEPVSVVHEGVPKYSRDTIFVDQVAGLEGTDVSTRVTATRPVTLQSASVDDPVERYALLYGVEEDGSPNTEYAGYQDTYDLKHRLVDYCGFTYNNMRYRVQEHDANTTDEVNVDDVKADLDWLASKVDANDIVLFYYAGSSSVGTENQLDFSDGSLTRSELEAYFAALQTENLVALFDCDNAGELAGELKAPGRLLMGSCAKGEERHEYAAADFTATAAVDAKDGNGAFTYYFVEALSKAAADTSGNGLVSAEEAFAYASPKTKELVEAKTLGDSQNPDDYDGIDGDVDLTVTDVPTGIVAQRSVYFTYGTASDGATSIGAPGTRNNWFLAEGCTGGGFDTYVLIMNPYDNWQKITAYYMTPTSTEPLQVEYECPPKFRYTIRLNDVPGLENTDVSTRMTAVYMDPPGASAAGYVSGNSGVVVERAMYFVYSSPNGGAAKTGGTCSIGFGE